MHPKALDAVTKTFLATSILVLILSILVPTLTIFNNITLAKKGSSSFAFSSLALSDKEFNGILIELNARAPNKASLSSLTLTYDIKPFGNVAQSSSRFSRSCNVTIGGNGLHVNSGGTIPKGLVKILIADGDSNAYPLDHYVTEFLVLAQSEGTALPVALSVGGQSSEFSFSPKLLFEEQDEAENAIGISIKYSRSGLQIAFSFFSVVLMWFITIVTLGYSSLLWFTPQTPPLLLPIISIAFALPRLRDIQPGIVDVGTSSDYYAFFPCMFIAFVNSNFNLI
jgi:hypothetical protein